MGKGLSKWLEKGKAKTTEAAAAEAAAKADPTTWIPEDDDLEYDDLAACEKVVEKLHLGDAEKAASLTDAHHRRENLADLMFKERAAVHTGNMKNDRSSERTTSLQRDLHKLGQRSLQAGSIAGPEGFDYFDEQTDYGKCGKLKRCCRRFGLCNRGQKERVARPGHALPSEKAPSVIKGVWGADGVEDDRTKTNNLSRKIE